MSKFESNWKEFQKYNKESWNSFTTKCANVPWYIWVLQIVYLVTLFGGMILSIEYMTAWMDTVSCGHGPGEYRCLARGELIFWGWMFGTIAGMFLYRYIFSTSMSYVLSKLNLLPDEPE